MIKISFQKYENYPIVSDKKQSCKKEPGTRLFYLTRKVYLSSRILITRNFIPYFRGLHLPDYTRNS